MKALVADDSRLMRTFIGRVLREAGIEVIEACDGREALELLGVAEPPDLLLLDWHMPDMSGIELLCVVRSRPNLSRVRVLMVTSEASAENLKAALDSGADDYLMKPFGSTELLGKLAAFGVPLDGPGQGGAE